MSSLRVRPVGCPSTTLYLGTEFLCWLFCSWLALLLCFLGSLCLCLGSGYLIGCLLCFAQVYSRNPVSMFSSPSGCYAVGVSPTLLLYITPLYCVSILQIKYSFNLDFSGIYHSEDEWPMRGRGGITTPGHAAQLMTKHDQPSTRRFSAMD